MRNYSSFLLLEDVLDYVPQDNQALYQFAQNVTRPRVKVVEEDCLTKVGRVVTINYEIEGLIELATDLSISLTRITTLLAAGTYTVAVRDLHSCVSVDGICRKCYKGTYVDQTAPAVNAFVKLEPEYNYQTDVFAGDGSRKKFTLSEPAGNYTKILVFIQGVLQTSGYSVANDEIILTAAPSSGIHVVVKFYTITTQPFVGYLAESYTGSLLGMKPLPTQTIHVRPSLAQTLISEEELEIMKAELINNYKTITRNYVEYIDKVDDKLEKAIYLSMLYGLYSNVTT